MAEAERGGDDATPKSKKHIWIEVTLGGQGAFKEAAKLTTTLGNVLNRTKKLLPPDEARKYVDLGLAKYCEPLGD